MFINFNKNLDSRRNLYDWNVDFTCKSIKLIELFPGNTVGKHYHKEKEELFILTNGVLDKIIIGTKEFFNIKSPAAWLIKKGVYHEYNTKNKITLLCLASKEFDSKDDFIK